MNIYEFADLIDKNIVIKRYPNQKGRFSAEFESCETKHGAFLCSESGDGENTQEALNDYKIKITGKTLVFNAMSNDRQEYVAPKMEDI